MSQYLTVDDLTEYDSGSVRTGEPGGEASARELVVFKDNSQPESSFYCEVNHYSLFGSALRISEKKTLPRIRRRLYR